MPPTTTTDPKDPGLKRGVDDSPVPQNDKYLVLPDEEIYVNPEGGKNGVREPKNWKRPYRDRYRHVSCGSITTMGEGIARTYARDPQFYGATYCCHCQMHRPVTEFRWLDDGTVVGS